jgi:hypothetical protein
MRRYPILAAAVFLSLVLMSPLGQADDYAPWQGSSQGGGMQQLLKDLRALIAKAESAKAADPVFLSDLRKLADSYDTQSVKRLLFDDFHDGDFTRNPAWTVGAGTWRVDLKGKFPGLQSRVGGGQATGTTSGGSSTQQAVLGILGSLLNAPQSGQTQQAAPDQFASISTALSITNAFALRLQIASRQPGGRFDLGVYIGQQSQTGYFLSYLPATANGLVLSSATNSGGMQQIGSSPGPVKLENEAWHVIDWKRDRAGRMTVALDGKPLIDATDMSITTPFEGFLLANSGGSYSIKSVTIDTSN